MSGALADGGALDGTSLHPGSIGYAGVAESAASDQRCQRLLASRLDPPILMLCDVLLHCVKITILPDPD